MENTILWDAVPTQRKKKEEKYSTAVLTMHKVEKVGGARKFEFNKAAQTALGIVGKDKVSFGYNAAEKRVFLRKSTLDTALELTQTCTLSDKRTYEYIAKNFGINIEEGAEFDLLPASIAEGAYELRVIGASIIADIPTLTISKVELGEISDEEELEADLSSLPEIPQGGVEYVEEPTFESGIDTTIEHDANDVVDQVEVEMPFDVDNVEVMPETAPKRVKFAVDNTEEEVATVPAPEEEAEEEDEW
jgi:hypothetical protein